MAKMIKKEEPNIVYSSDGSHKKAKKVVYQDIVPSEHILKIRLETNKRAGKAVSVVFELPENPEYFKKLAKKLKASCGTGGSFKENTIEVQGDHREKLKELLEVKGFGVKLAGGR